MRSAHIVYASTSGHTEHVVSVLEAVLKAKGVQTSSKRAELETARGLQDADVLILASGTWNFGGVEGQLNEKMHELLFQKAKEVQRVGKPIAFISLGDSRYYFTTRCTQHFKKFQKACGAVELLMPLIIVNEPYGQEAKIETWGNKLLVALQKGSQ